MRCLRGGIGIEQQGIHSGFELGEPFVLFLQQLQALVQFELSLLELALELLRPLLAFEFSLLDVVDGSPVERRQQAPPKRQGGDPFRSGHGLGVFGSGRGSHRRSSSLTKSGAARHRPEASTNPGDPAAGAAALKRAALNGFAMSSP